jgi:TolB-like protein
VAGARKIGEKSKWYQSRKVAFALAIVLMVGVSAVIIWFLSDKYEFENQVGLKRSQNLPELAETVIAVLPFTIIGDSSIGRQLTAGLSEDVVTELSHVDDLQVIAYGSSSRLSDHHNPQDDARSLLGATHLVRGSIQFEADSFRIDVHLEDLVKNRQIWAESFDFRLENILSAQAEIARQVSAALAVAFPNHRQTEFEQTAAINFEARVLINQAMIVARPSSDPARVQAGTLLFERAIELEPLAPSGYAGVAYLQAKAAWYGSVQDVDSALETAVTNAKKAISLDRNSVRTLLALAVVAMLNDDYEKAIEHLDTAILTRPSYALTNAWRGAMLTFAGQARQGILPLLTAIRLDPINPRTPYLNMLGVAYFHSGDIKTAVETITRNFKNNGPRGPHTVAYLVAGYFHLGEMDKARQAFQDFQKIEKGFPLERWLQLSFQDPKDVEMVLGALRQLRAEN